MTNELAIGPTANELEVSLFGPGYGEAIAVHFGAGHWMLVDSCEIHDEGEPASLSYLAKIGADVGKCVKLVVATHWHDDHMRGLGAIVDAAESAQVWIPSLFQKNEMQHLLKMYSSRTAMEETQSGLDELNAVFEVLESRKSRNAPFSPVKLASADKILFEENLSSLGDGCNVAIYSLSPSDEAVLQAMLALGKYLPEIREQKKRIAVPSKNRSSVVLWCMIGGHRILLGADLERTASPQSGWSVIVEESQAVDGKADVFKVPHHGSENGHHDAVWNDLLVSNPLALLTPFNKGRVKLPTTEDIARLRKLSPHVYSSARPPVDGYTKWRNPVVREKIKDVAESMKSVQKGSGHIRLRRHIVDENDEWCIELFGDAIQV